MYKEIAIALSNLPSGEFDGKFPLNWECSLVAEVNKRRKV